MRAVQRKKRGSRKVPIATSETILVVGGEAVTSYDQKVTCGGGALAVSEPEKSPKQIRDIVESTYDHGADMIVTTCPLCQVNVEIYQKNVNKRYGTRFNMPVPSVPLGSVDDRLLGQA